MFSNLSKSAVEDELGSANHSKPATLTQFYLAEKLLDKMSLLISLHAIPRVGYSSGLGLSLEFILDNIREKKPMFQPLVLYPSTMSS